MPTVKSVKLCGVKSLFLGATILAAVLVPLGCGNAPADKPAATVSQAPPALPKVAPAKATFTSKEHGFALYLPSEPEQQQQKMPADMGEGTIDSFVIAPDPVAYTVVVMKMPQAAVDMDEARFFDGVEKGILESTQGERLGSQDVEVNGRNPRELKTSFSTPTDESETPVKFVTQSRIYRVGERNLQFFAIVPEAKREANQAQIDKVLNSVVITE